MISDADKNQILNSFVKNIAAISDKEYQKRVWVLAEGTECDDIDDTICDFFDEDYVLEKYKEFGITEEQHKLLLALHRKLRRFADTFGVYSPGKSTGELIQLPEWQEIINLAKDVLKVFDYKEQTTNTCINRKEILEGFLDNLQRISDREYQIRIWIEGRGPECHDFDEAVCDFFGDSDSILEHYKDFGLTKAQQWALKNFRDRFKAFSDENNLPQEFITSQEWEEITNLAKDLLKMFGYQKKEEKNHIFNGFLKDVTWVSNRDHEEKIRAFAEEPKEDDLDKTISRLIETSVSIMENYKNFEITNDQYNLIKNFHAQLKVFFIENSFLRDAHEWEEIRKTAKEILKAFNCEGKPL